MKKASITVDTKNIISKVDPRLYGSFIEHLGRAVYGGIYQPGHITADSDGFRDDVIELVRELGVPIVRYPGGNFVSGYDWRDGVGDRAGRPRRLELAWQTIETNEVGLGEFAAWCEKANADLMYAVNLGTGTPDDARKLVEYANHPSGTKLSDLRIAHGRQAPYNIKTWCLGNEMDGPWQICAKTAAEYGRIAAETAKVMKLVDDSIELVACGSSHGRMPTFGVWEEEVLDHTYDHVEYLSLHSYYENKENDTASFLTRNIDMDEFIKSVTKICDMVKARKKSDKTMFLSFDEWNVWYHSREDDLKVPRWSIAPRQLEDIYNFEDALLVGGLLITLLKNADRVKIACLAQLVNVIAPIMTDPEHGAWRQTIFFPFMQASKNGRGTAISVSADSPKFNCTARENVDSLDTVATLSDCGSDITLFILNRNIEDDLETTITVENAKQILEHSQLAGFDFKVENSLKSQTVAPVALPATSLEGECVTVTIPKASWSVIKFKL